MTILKLSTERNVESAWYCAAAESLIIVGADCMTDISKRALPKVRAR